MVLIINSHLDAYYPIPHIGTGGAIGNSVFFCMSGFGLYLSQEKKYKSFSLWIKDRINRIYPSTWIVLAFLSIPIMIFLGQFDSQNVLTVIGHFFYPPFWFLQALLAYYLLSFFLFKKGQKNTLFCVLGALAILYIALYISWVDLSKWSVEALPFKLIHCFIIFLFGIYLAMKNNSIVYTGWHNYIVLILLITVVYGHKFLMSKGLYPEFQFIQQAAMYPIMFYLLKISRAPFLSSILIKSTVLLCVVRFISDHSLELYIIHETISMPVLKFNFLFPINMIFFLILTFILSAMVHRLSVAFRNKINTIS